MFVGAKKIQIGSDCLVGYSRRNYQKHPIVLLIGDLGSLKGLR